MCTILCCLSTGISPSAPACAVSVTVSGRRALLSAPSCGGTYSLATQLRFNVSLTLAPYCPPGPAGVDVTSTVCWYGVRHDRAGAGDHDGGAGAARMLPVTLLSGFLGCELHIVMTLLSAAAVRCYCSHCATAGA